jgi:hypothetical protein
MGGEGVWILQMELYEGTEPYQRALCDFASLGQYDEKTETLPGEVCK